MKGIIKVLILCGTFAILNYAIAAGDDATTSPQPTNTNSGMWICTTNASSAASGSTDEQADKAMANTAANGNTAFDFALKNCRDCNKITCELQTNSQ